MGERIDVLWVSEELGSAEHFTLVRDASAGALGGTVVLPIDGVPAHLRYAVRVDEHWRTQRVEVDIVGDSRRRLEIEVSDERWIVDGDRRADLDGCVDVDLGWTPATNLLPIRRLAPAVGESVSLEVAWLRFPELDIVANRQSYTRLDTESWRYESGPFDATLTTAQHGVVTRYGHDLWRAAAITTAHAGPE